MTVSAQPKIWTDEEFMALPDNGDRYELVNGEVKGLKKLPKGFFDGAPDLAVEVISPSNTFEEIHQKIVEYFESGSRLVWVINPDEESVVIYRGATPDRLLKITDFLDGEEVVTGFRLTIAELFTDLDSD